VFQWSAQLLVQVFDGNVRPSDRVLLGPRVCLSRLQQYLVLDSLRPSTDHPAVQLPSSARPLPRHVCRSVLRDVRPVSVEDRRQVVERVDRLVRLIKLMHKYTMIVSLHRSMLVDQFDFTPKYD